MKKLSEIMKNVTERQDFVKNEELKRKYREMGFQVPIEEQVYKPHDFLSREAFLNDRELNEKYRKAENISISGKAFNLKPLSHKERCLGFGEFLKSRMK